MMTAIRQPILLIVDDEVAILDTLKEALEDENFIVETLADGSKVLETIGRLVPDVVLLDIFMPQFNGIDALAKIKREYPAQKVIMISGFGTIPIVVDAFRKGAMDFIEKPLNLDEILAKLSFLKDSGDHVNHEQTLFSQAATQANGLVGASALFCELLHHAALIAPLDLPVMIYGPAGSGKTMLAGYLHDHSGYSHDEFVTLSCATLERITIECLPLRGTVFLKNVHELCDAAQKDLLELITQGIKNIRFIASAPSDLFKYVTDGLFNRSLFCKFNMTPLEIPSINKRRYDIPLLVDHFLKSANQKCDRSVGLTPATVRFLRNYHWTGDVNHIKTVVESIVRLAQHQNSIMDVSDVQTLLPAPTSYLDEQLFSRFHSLEQATDAFQSRYLIHMLKMHRYDVKQLAEFLQVPLAQLQDKMIKLHVNHERAYF